MVFTAPDVGLRWFTQGLFQRDLQTCLPHHIPASGAINLTSTQRIFSTALGSIKSKAARLRFNASSRSPRSPGRWADLQITGYPWEKHRSWELSEKSLQNQSSFHLNSDSSLVYSRQHIKSKCLIAGLELLYNPKNKQTDWTPPRTQVLLL